MLYSRWVLLGPLEAFEVGGIALTSQTRESREVGCALCALGSQPPSHHAFSRHPKVFVELNELLLDKNQEPQWRETARWIKFEEDVEEETERWGKPHVASLSFRSLLELRRTLAHGNARPPVLDVGTAFARARSPRTKRSHTFVLSNRVCNVTRAQKGASLVMMSLLTRPAVPRALSLGDCRAGLTLFSGLASSASSFSK